MKTYITRKQERTLYKVIDQIKELHVLEQYENLSMAWSCYYYWIDEVLAKVFPKIEVSELRLYIINELQEYNWETSASYLIDKCKDKWLWYCETDRALRTWLHTKWGQWEERKGQRGKMVKRNRRQEQQSQQQQ